MKHVIIGTAGHVDHGKTTLVQALTGVNPDRLKEEQERGMTIDIGFASLKLPDGNIAGIIDVPGHERFLKNMLTGTTGIDVALLVIAADEGVMPQTVEHFDILRLLDVRNGVIALTKIDRVDKNWTDLIEQDVRRQFNDSFLAEAPIIRVSAATGKGIEALRRILQSAVSRAESRNTILPFRLPIDRVFTRPGFGTVVTGTLISGSLRVGDAAELAPNRRVIRIRGLQIHGQKVIEAEAGARVAINLAGIETSEIERGNQLVAPASLMPTRTFDGVISILPQLSKAVKDRSRVRLHIGTAEIIGRIKLLDNRSELAPGDTAYIQFRGEHEFACFRNDRFILRSFSPKITIGGGKVLDSAPIRHSKDRSELLASLSAREHGTPADLVESALMKSIAGVIKQEISALIGILKSDVDSALSELSAKDKIVFTANDRIFSRSSISTFTDRATEALTSYHTQFPLRGGMPKEELRTVLGRSLDIRAFSSLIGYWQQQSHIVVQGNLTHLANFEVQLNPRQESLLQRIEEIYEFYGINTPTLEEVCRSVKAPPDAINALIKFGVERQRFFRVSDGIYYTASTLTSLKRQISNHILTNGNISVGDLRDLASSNRKFALQALEYLDSIRFTRRVGDQRILFTHTSSPNM